MQTNSFGERLRFAIDHSGLTTRQLAELLEVPLAWLDEELIGQTALPQILTAGHLAQACKLCGVTWAWLVEGEPTPAGVAAAKRFRNSAIHFSADEIGRVSDLLEAIV